MGRPINFSEGANQFLSNIFRSIFQEPVFFRAADPFYANSLILGVGNVSVGYQSMSCFVNKKSGQAPTHPFTMQRMIHSRKVDAAGM